MAIRFEKGNLIITLETGKETYMNINTGVITGVSGKAVKTFSAEAKGCIRNARNVVCQTLKEENYICTDKVKIAEKVMNMFPAYDYPHLDTITCYCLRNPEFLDKQNLKFYRTYVEKSFLEKDSWFSVHNFTTLIQKAKDDLFYAENKIPEEYKEIFQNLNDETKMLLLKHLNGIIYAYEHEHIEETYKLFRGGWGSVGTQVAGMLANYIRDCELLETKPVWKNVVKNLTIAHKEAEMIRLTKPNPIVVVYQTEYNLKYENDEIEVIVPTTQLEFKHEADYQRNCVFSYYYPRVEQEKTHIVFIRKKNDIDKPYITCEINNFGVIVQYLTRFNKSVCDELGIDFRAEYQHYLNTIFA